MAMTAGEFMRKLKEAIKAEGYTSNNVIITGVGYKGSCFEVNLTDSHYENPMTIYLDEN